MSEERLQNLSILAIEKKLASELCLDGIINILASEDKTEEFF